MRSERLRIADALETPLERLDERGIRHSGVKDRGFMDSIYFTDPLGLLIELASYRFEPPAGCSHADVMLEAHDRLQEYLRDPKMPFHLWLRHLAKDRIIDMHRHHRGALRRSLDREQPLASPAFGEWSSFDLATQLRDDELTPAAASIRKELEARFLAALEQLDDEDREILLMRHFEHLGNSEVAQALGLSSAAAGMRATSRISLPSSIRASPRASTWTSARSPDGADVASAVSASSRPLDAALTASVRMRSVPSSRARTLCALFQVMSVRRFSPQPTSRQF